MKIHFVALFVILSVLELIPSFAYVLLRVNRLSYRYATDCTLAFVQNVSTGDSWYLAACRNPLSLAVMNHAIKYYIIDPASTLLASLICGIKGNCDIDVLALRKLSRTRISISMLLRFHLEILAPVLSTVYLDEVIFPDFCSLLRSTCSEHSATSNLLFHSCTHLLILSLATVSNCGV